MSKIRTALEKLISCLISAPMMAYPDPNSPYVLHTDAVEDPGLEQLNFKFKITL